MVMYVAKTPTCSAIFLALASQLLVSYTALQSVPYH